MRAGTLNLRLPPTYSRVAAERLTGPWAAAELGSQHSKPGDTTMAFNAFMPSESDGGFVIYGFPTETIRPTESVDDGGYVIDWFPTETVCPILSPDDGGIIPTETIRPMESLHPSEVLI